MKRTLEVPPPPVSACQQCRYKKQASSVTYMQMKGPYGPTFYTCDKGHHWTECREHDFKIRPIDKGEKIYDMKWPRGPGWCVCKPEPPVDDGESTWVEVKGSVTGGGRYSREYTWEETMPRSLLNLYVATNPTICFESLYGKYGDVEEKFVNLGIVVSSTSDEDLDKWLESFCKGHLGSELDQSAFYDKNYKRFRLFHSKWTPEVSAAALAKECGFSIKE